MEVALAGGALTKVCHRHSRLLLQLHSVTELAGLVVSDLESALAKGMKVAIADTALQKCRTIPVSLCSSPEHPVAMWMAT